MARHSTARQQDLIKYLKPFLTAAEVTLQRGRADKPLQSTAIFSTLSSIPSRRHKINNANVPQSKDNTKGGATTTPLSSASSEQHDDHDPTRVALSPSQPATAIKASSKAASRTKHKGVDRHPREGARRSKSLKKETEHVVSCHPRHSMARGASPRFTSPPTPPPPSRL